MTEISVPAFIFVVDTTSYAGNFERELCAAVTGELGICGVGDKERDMFRGRFPDVDFSEIIAQVQDDHGNPRPVSIYPTPGYYNDGMGGAYTDADDPTEVYKRYVKANEDYYQPHIVRAEKYIADGDARWERDLAGYHKRLADAREQGPGKFPSYQSVAIYFDTRPSEEQIAFLKDRANEYAAKKKLTILGFRLVQNVLTTTEQAI